MVSLPFFEIPYGDRLAKNVKKRYVQVIPRSMPYPTSRISAKSRLEQTVVNLGQCNSNIIITNNNNK